MALGACGYAGGDEIEAESAAILARVPVGTSFNDVPDAMAALGFSMQHRPEAIHRRERRGA